ncbi:MAG TPA: hypothetical protein VFG54_04575 [Prolixibacteraceae bacterium]|nr:hypothetical protein [Prolixibacteraceae bacterium]
MKVEKESGKLCFFYEMFMERAYGTYEICVPGCCALDMKGLMLAEEEKAVSFESGAHFEELLLTVKKHINEALDSYMAKPNVPEEIIEELKRYKDLVTGAVGSDELIKIVTDTIDLTVNISLDMK